MHESGNDHQTIPLGMQRESHSLDEVLSRRLAKFGALSPEEIDLLKPSALGTIRRAEARHDLIREGEHPRAVFLILSGWACRHKTLEDGRRQIVAFLIPGDLCDLNNTLLLEMDHSLNTLTPVQYVEIAHDQIERIAEGHPRISRALWRQLLATISVQREWTLNLGQRSALERIGHLFCELFVRLRAVGLAEPDRFELPITQLDIAEATGLTAVHVNRTIQEMRAQNLIILGNRVLRFPDFGRLCEIALFSPAYLHFQPDQSAVAHDPSIGVVPP